MGKPHLTLHISSSTSHPPHLILHISSSSTSHPLSHLILHTSSSTSHPPMLLLLPCQAGNDSDGHDSLRSLFSPPELDRNSINTELSFQAEPKDLHKKLPEDAAPVAERPRKGDSTGGNSMSFALSSGKYLRAADGPVLLDGDGSTVDLRDHATPQGLGGGIPLNISSDCGDDPEEDAGRHPETSRSAEPATASMSNHLQSANVGAEIVVIPPVGDVDTCGSANWFNQTETPATGLPTSPLLCEFRSQIFACPFQQLHSWIRIPSTAPC
jgi:hypothetical protein